MNIDLTIPNISYFNPPIWNTLPAKKISYVDVYRLITSDTLMDITHRVRTIDNNLKVTECPSISPSGVFYIRCDDGMKYHNEVMCMDIDDIEGEEEFEEIKQKLIDDRSFYTLLLFRSPSGCGMKWFTPINLHKCGHRVWFDSIRNYLYQKYSIISDKKCINPSRTCFLCHDPEAYACKEIIDNIKMTENGQQQL